MHLNSSAALVAFLYCLSALQPVLARDAAQLYDRAGAPIRPPTRPKPTPKLPGEEDLEIPPPPVNENGVAEDGTPALGSTSEEDDAQFKLGDYDTFGTLFESFEGAQDPFFSKVYDIFSKNDPDFYATIHPYLDVQGDQQPFPNERPSGQPIRFTRTITAPSLVTYESVFKPGEPTAVCGVWASLANYCGGGDLGCACYSGQYYVPEQWNSLAAGCASFASNCPNPDSSYWCDVAQSAFTSMNNCPDVDADGNPATVRFAVTHYTAPPNDQPSQSVGNQPDQSDGDMPTQTPSPGDVFQTTQASATPVITTSTSDFTPFQTPTPTTSRSPDPVKATFGTWIALVTLFLYWSVMA